MSLSAPFSRALARLGGIYETLPHAARRGLAVLLTAAPPVVWDALARLVPEHKRPERLGEFAHKLAAWVRLTNSDLLFREIRSLWSEPETLVLGATA